MKKFKKLIAFLMVTAILASAALLPCNVFAENETEAEVAEETVVLTKEDKILMEKLEALGAVKAQFTELDTTVSRRQMTELIAHYMQLPEYAGIKENPFLDVSVDDASIGSITALYDSNIISGNGDLRFRPDDSLTYNEAICVMLHALGYKTIAQYMGGYPAGYLAQASKIALLNGIAIKDYDGPISLRDFLKMMENGFDAPTVVLNVNDKGSLMISNTDTFLTTVYKMSYNEGIVTGNHYTNYSGTDTDPSDEVIEIDFRSYDTPGYTYWEMLGKSVKYYYYIDESDVITYVEENDKENKITTINDDDIVIGKCTNEEIYYETDNNSVKSVKVSRNAEVIYNGKRARGYSSIVSMLPKADTVGFEGSIDLVDNNDDKVADILFIYRFENSVLNSVDTIGNEIIVEKHDGTEQTIELDMDVDPFVIYLMPGGERIDNINKLKAGDVISYMESLGASDKVKTLYVSRDRIEGTIEKSNASKGVAINDTYYRISESYIGDTIELNMSAIFCLDFRGEIAAVDYNLTSGLDGNYAVIAAVSEAEVFGDPIIHLFTTDGELVSLQCKMPFKIDGSSYSTQDALFDKICDITGGTPGSKQVYKAIVVEYKMAGDKISSIITANATSDHKTGELNLIEDNSNELLPRDTSNIMRIRTQTTVDGSTVTNYQFTQYNKNNIIVFAVPEPGKMDNISSYGIMKDFKTAHYKSNDTGSTVVVKDSSAVYSFLKTDIPNADIVLLRGNDGSTGLNVEATSIHIFRETMYGYNSEDEVTPMLAMDSDTTKSLASEFDFAEGGAEPVTKSSSDWEGLGINKGDILQVAYNAYGDINSISRLATYDAEAGTLTGNYTNSGSIGQSEKVRYVGKITAIDSVNGFALIEDNGGNSAMFNLKNSSIVLYRAELEEASTAMLSALKKGDLIVVKGSNYYNIQETIVIR